MIYTTLILYNESNRISKFSKGNEPKFKTKEKALRESLSLTKLLCQNELINIAKLFC